MENRLTKFTTILFSTSLIFCLLFLLVHAHADQDQIDLTSLSLEELMNIEVTSVSKKPQKLSDAAAAIFVITQEDIRRSGVTNIMDALRMVPGLEVARIDASIWAISSRGLNGRFSNKLLVLMDGRSIYTPLFSGVYWDMQDTMIEDIDRIEVIRGPGASLWGANAVNGVINIITKRSGETQGGLATAGAGTEEQGFAGFRYGAKAGEHLSYRLYGKYFKRDDAVFASGDKAADQWHAGRGGFRLDWDPGSNDSYTLQGDISDGEAGETAREHFLTPPYSRISNNENDFKGGNILGRWTHTLSESSDLALQVYYDVTKRDNPIIGIKRDTIDIDLQHRVPLAEKHEVIWGLGYRYTKDSIENSDSLIFTPASRDDELFSAFLQADITLVDNRLYLTLGSKFEENDYTGFEVQPSGRIMWTPKEKVSVWSSVSRAVRTPSRAEHDARINQAVLPPGSLYMFSPAAQTALFASDDFESEELIAYETGIRFWPHHYLSMDIAAFYNDYDRMRTFETGSMLCEPSGSTFPACLPTDHVVIPSTADNKMQGETYGVELASDWKILDWWNIRAAYTYLQIQMHLDEDSTDTTSESAEGESPHNQFSLRSSADIGMDVDLDLWVRYVDNLKTQDVDKYITLDARLGWKPVQNLELSLTGQNLLDSQHPEFNPEIVDVIPTEVQRSVYGKITWEF
ncbi:MAG: TonB-dependent receptor [Nitrospira bacterium SG8_35_4]|nr:MAG: TonB-dependent receptor [Nitrospira bacterium SG8_35_4]